MRMRKKSYEAPRLVVYGKLEEITKESNGGSKLDNDFSAGTSSSDLTFS